MCRAERPTAAGNQAASEYPEGHRAAIRSHYEREDAANRLVVMRSGVTQADLATTVRTLRALGAVSRGAAYHPGNADDQKIPRSREIPAKMPPETHFGV